MIDPAVGILLEKKVGDRVEIGEPLCTLLVNDLKNLEDEVLPMATRAFSIGDESPKQSPIVLDRL